MGSALFSPIDRFLIFYSAFKLKPANRNTSWCTLMAQSPKTSQGGASLSSKVPLPSMKTVQPISTSSLTKEVEAVIHALGWTASRGDSRTTHAIILTDSMSLLQKVKTKWNGKPRLECVNGRHPPSKTPVGALPWPCQSEGK